MACRTCGRVAEAQELLFPPRLDIQRFGDRSGLLPFTHSPSTEVLHNRSGTGFKNSVVFSLSRVQWDSHL